MKKIIFILSIIAIVGIAIRYATLPISSVTCVSQYGVCKSEVVDSLKSFEKKPLIIGFNGLKKYLTSSPWIISYKVTFTFPTEVHVDTILKEAKIAMKPINGQEYTLYTEDGNVIATTQSTTLPLPVVNFYQKVNSDKLSFIASLSYQLIILSESHEVSVKDDGIVVNVHDKTFIYPFDGDIDVLLGATRVVLGELNSNSENFTMKTIDFRYKNPVGI